MVNFPDSGTYTVSNKLECVYTPELQQQIQMRLFQVKSTHPVVQAGRGFINVEVKPTVDSLIPEMKVNFSPQSGWVSWNRTTAATAIWHILTIFGWGLVMDCIYCIKARGFELEIDTIKYVSHEPEYLCSAGYQDPMATEMGLSYQL